MVRFPFIWALQQLPAKIAFRNLPLKAMPNIQIHNIDVGQINDGFMRAQSIYLTSPLLKLLKCGELFFLDQQQRHLLMILIISSKLLIFENAQHPKVAAAFSFWSRAAKAPIINISYRMVNIRIWVYQVTPRQYAKCDRPKLLILTTRYLYNSWFQASPDAFWSFWLLSLLSDFSLILGLRSKV